MTDVLLLAACAVAGAVGAIGLRLLEGRKLEELGVRVRKLRRTAGADVDLTRVPRLPHAIDAELELLASELEARERERKAGEDLLRMMLAQAPSAIVFLSSKGTVLLANDLARDLFFDGADLVGKSFLAMMSRAPEALKRAMVGAGDELLSLEDAEGDPRTFHLAKRHVPFGDGVGVLVAMHDLTHEIGRREVEVWRNVIRVLAHEVNNSLAPMKTVASTGRVLARETPAEERLGKIFDTVTERASHLAEFLEGYARLAKLPLPRKGDVALGPLAERLRELWPGLDAGGDLDAPGHFDAAQIEQLLVNLVKNALEAGSAVDDVEVRFETRDARVLRLVVRDRGHGMAPDVLKNALVPLFSTKPGGRGLGLALCREIAEAHGGTLRLRAREGGGLEVVVKLPRAGLGLPPTASIVLTRGS